MNEMNFDEVQQFKFIEAFFKIKTIKTNEVRAIHEVYVRQNVWTVV